ALFNIAVCERKQLNFREAEHRYLEYTRKFSSQADGWVNLAECQFQLNNFPESLRSARTALALNPASAEAWTTQGDCLKVMKRPQEALESYEQAARAQPNAVASLNHGVLLAELGRYGEAVPALSTALHLAPDMLQARSSRADALNQLGRFEEAIAD